jgi:uncharacterized protein with ATP-grasp and redox domains
MKTTYDCIPCIVSHIVHVAKMVTMDDDLRREIIKKTLAEVVDADFSITPPEQARLFHKIIRKVTGVDDPYREVKDCSTKFALELLPFFRDVIATKSDRFDAIVRLVIGGNIIDYGADKDFQLDSAKQKILDVFDMPLDIDAVRQLEHAMNSAKTILYIADNCGEAVFDRLLIEPYREKIILGVRGEPILNDITMREVAESGLEGLPVRIIDTGDMTPGVSINHSSREFMDEMFNADLVVAKGQGNFETLSDYDRPIFFLLRSKCKVISALLGGGELGSLHVIPKNI